MFVRPTLSRGVGTLSGLVDERILRPLWNIASSVVKQGVDSLPFLSSIFHFTLTPKISKLFPSKSLREIHDNSKNENPRLFVVESSFPNKQNLLSRRERKLERIDRSRNLTQDHLIQREKDYQSWLHVISTGGDSYEDFPYVFGPAVDEYLYP